jgi:hypothetical protein
MQEWTERKPSRLIENTISAGRKDVVSQKGYWEGYLIEEAREL